LTANNEIKPTGLPVPEHTGKRFPKSFERVGGMKINKKWKKLKQKY